MTAERINDGPVEILIDGNMITTNVYLSVLFKSRGTYFQWRERK